VIENFVSTGVGRIFRLFPRANRSPFWVITALFALPGMGAEDKGIHGNEVVLAMGTRQKGPEFKRSDGVPPVAVWGCGRFLGGNDE
jgi:hypothetical protein